MKIYFNSLTRPKRAAKALVELVPNLKLSKSQEAVAYICGYASWDDLRKTSEAATTAPSIDDEDLAEPELEARRTLQAERAREFFRNTAKQARTLVDTIAPSGRLRSKEAPEQVVGTNVYMPDFNLCFGPNYPCLYELLHDVTALELDFIQPTAEEPFTMTHLVSEMRLTFNSGKTLTVDGVLLWKFRDLVPAPLSDGKGGYKESNPYSSETADDLVWRIRTAHDQMFTQLPRGQHVGDPPLQIKLNLAGGLVTTVRAPGLEPATRKQLEQFLESVAKPYVLELQPMVDKLMRGYLDRGYMTLEPRLMGNGMIGQSYVPRAWAGREGTTFKDFLSTFSPAQRHASGCGGNRTFGELLEADLLACLSTEDIVVSWFELLKKESTDLFKLVCEDLGVSSRTAGKTLARQLLKTKEENMLEWHVTSPLLKAQEGRVLSDWAPVLPVRKAAPPTRRSSYGVPKVEGDSHA